MFGRCRPWIARWPLAVLQTLAAVLCLSVLVVGLDTRPAAAAPADQPAPSPAPAVPAASSRPDLVSARIVAAASGSRVEVTSMDTEASTTWANPDGSLTTDYSTTPVRMRADDGSWTPIATKVSAPAADGSLSVADNPLAPTFAADAASARAVTVDTDRGSLSMGLKGAGHAEVVGKGSTASYDDVLPGTDLVYEVQPDAVKESIVVSDASRSSWTFQVNTRGLTPAQDDSGSLVFTDGKRHTVLTIPAALAWDSAGRKGVREPSTTSARLSYAAEAGGGWLVTVSVDPAWLADPARVFPVTVDPTVSYAPDAGTAYKSDGTTCAISACG
jgi:hypothetical protein